MWLDHLRQDVAYAVRQYTRAKGYTLLVVLVLALGIGATTAIYSAVDVMILNPIPGADSDRLVQVGEWEKLQNLKEPQRLGLSPYTLAAVSDVAGEMFEEMAWSEYIIMDRRGSEFDLPTHGQLVSENFFQVIGQQPLLGRVFGPGDAIEIGFINNYGGTLPNGCIILSYEAWQSDFGGNPGIVGTEIELSGSRQTVIGVMPGYFRYPTGARFWLASKPRHTVQGVRARPQLLGRLKPNMQAKDLQPMLDTIAQRVLSDRPADRTYAKWHGTALRLWCEPLRIVLQSGAGYEWGFNDLRRTLYGFLAAIGFILAIACANISSMALARAEERRHEFAVRAALGAGRRRLMQQLLTESLLLSAAGGVAGLGVAQVAVKLFATFQTRPQFRPLEIDVRMLAVALIVSIGCGVACGLLPALQGGRRRVSDALAQGSQSASASRSGRQLRNGLVVLEVSLAVVLLVGAGLMVTSVVKLLRIDPGFDASELVRIQTNWGPRSGITFQTEAAAISQLHERFAAMPGIKSVGVLASGGGEILSLNGAADPVVMLVRFAGVENADYFRAAGIPLLGGRRLDRSDAGEQMRNAIVNRALANAAWPGEDPIGKTLEMPWRGLTYRVVGVVGDMRTALDREQHATLYLPFAHLKAGSVPEFVIRSNREPGELVPALRRALHEFNPNMRNPQIVAYRDMLFEGTRARRAYRDYLIGFASIGLVLSALGIYGVLSHSVARRTREIGIRMAVGADRGDVVRMVVGDGLRLAAVGIALGLMLSFWMTQLLRHQLYEVDATNVTVLVTVTVVLAATVLIAALLPARRAAAVNPIEALKA